MRPSVPRFRFLASLAALAVAACSDGPAAPVEAPGECARLEVAGTPVAARGLAPGDAMPLPATAALCLSIPGTSADGYALAYADARASEAARTAPEPARLDSFSVTVGPAGAAAAGVRASAAAAPAAPSAGTDVALVAAAAPYPGDPRSHVTPWTAGEGFPLYDFERSAPRPARVQRVYGGWLVVAAFTDEPVATLPQTLQHLDDEWPTLRDVGLPALRAVVSDALPASSRGSGQLLVIVRPDPPPGAAGITYGMADGDSTFSFIEMKPNDAFGLRSPSGTLGLLFHEMTHAFQRRYAATLRGPGEGPVLASSAATWALEGGAALMERELARRVTGIGLSANWDFRDYASRAEMDYRAFANVGRGEFAVGYAPSADFLLDLAERRMAAGEAVDVALAEVEHGAQEGWFGQGPAGARTGLAARMRARLGPAWDPADALLSWTLAHAVDDRTSSPDLQDRAFRAVWDPVSASQPWWTAHAELAPGAAPVAVRRMFEASGYFYLKGGTTYAITASVSGVRWKLVRFR
jgi:hypothetical protein